MIMGIIMLQRPALNVSPGSFLSVPDDGVVVARSCWAVARAWGIDPCWDARVTLLGYRCCLVAACFFPISGGCRIRGHGMCGPPQCRCGSVRRPRGPSVHSLIEKCASFFLHLQQRSGNLADRHGMLIVWERFGLLTMATRPIPLKGGPCCRSAPGATPRFSSSGQKILTIPWR